LFASSEPGIIAQSEIVIVVIGTPVDEHLNPDPQVVPNTLEALSENFRDGQLVVLRSTVYPGVTTLVEKTLAEAGLTVDVAFCPERIAEGQAMTEIYQFPQIVSGRTQRSKGRAAALFRHLTDDIVVLEPEEAELAKLFTNTYRYIKFAIANQLYMIANDFGLDYERIRHAVIHDYPRAADLPRAGFAAGPCLFKDTMQLAAFNNNNFNLGHAAMSINEGLPLYLVARLEQNHDLSKMTVGILGMAFKAESDDIRSSLSYKLKRILNFKAMRTLCTDPYVTVDDGLVPLEQVLEEADLLIIAAPHGQYREIETDVPVIDIWDLRGSGVNV
jgi:UDP-N-acetyl-D-mannosaminuronic acid dehydrogenase